MRGVGVLVILLGVMGGILFFEAGVTAGILFGVAFTVLGAAIYKRGTLCLATVRR